MAYHTIKQGTNATQDYRRLLSRPKHFHGNSANYLVELRTAGYTMATAIFSLVTVDNLYSYSMPEIATMSKVMQVSASNNRRPAHRIISVCASRMPNSMHERCQTARVQKNCGRMSFCIE